MTTTALGSLNDGYIPLPADCIRRYLEVHDTDSCIQQVVKLTNDSMMAGGVIVEQRNNAKRVKIDDRQRHRTSNMWKKWIIQIRRMKDAKGFAIGTITEDTIEGCLVPSVMDPEHVFIRYYRDINSQPHVKIYERPTKLGQKWMEREIDPSKYLMFWESPPTKDGVIRSRVALTIPDIGLEQMKIDNLTTAERILANPPLTLEVLPMEPQKETTLPSTMAGLNAPISLATREALSMTTNSNSQAAFATDRIEQLSSDFFALTNQLNNEGMRRAIQAIKNMDQTTMRSDTNVLPCGYKLVNQLLPQAPDDLPLTSLRKKNTVFGIWNVPLSMVDNSSTSSKSSMSNGTNSNALEIFQESQNQRKIDLVEDIHAMHYWMYGQAKILQSFGEKLTKEEPIEPADVEKTIEDCTPHIEIPGLPHDQIIWKLFTAGFLKYEALVRVMSSKYAFSEEHDFHATPQLTMQEINQLKDDLETEK